MADDLQLDVIVAARSAGVTAVLAEMRALASATARLQAGSKAATAGVAAVGAAARTAAPGVTNVAKGTTAANAAMAATAGAARQAATGVRKVNDENLRYASYDMAGTLLTVSAAITAVGAASLIAFAQQEKAFSSVERILAGDGLGTAEIENLRKELYELSETVPVAFGELSEIASFGAALDISANDLDEFSSVVARFTALTGTDAETAGKSLARIFQYTRESTPSLRKGEEFEQLGSAIVRLGNISISTESDVLQFAQSISPLGRRANVSAEQILAMATATSSFASINVEGAGSAFSRVFAIIDRVVASGGDSLTEFADISGLTASSFQAMWAEDAGGAFNRVLEGLNKDVPNLTANMDALGIRNERDKRVIRALAINYQDYARYMDEANTSVAEGTYLGESYAFIADDLASKWQVFINVLQNTGAAIGGTIAPAFTGLLGSITSLLQGLGEFTSHPIGGWIVRIAAAVAGMVAAWAAWRGAIALATAGALAFKTATSFLGGPGIGRGAQMLAAQITGVGVASQAATGKVAALGAASAAAGGAAGVGRMRAGLAGVVSFLGGPWGLALGAGAAVAMSAFSAMDSAAREARAGIIDSLKDVVDGVDTLNVTVKAADGWDPFGVKMKTAGAEAEELERALRNMDVVFPILNRSMGVSRNTGGLLEKQFGSLTNGGDSLANNLKTLTQSFNDLADDPARLTTSLLALGERYDLTTTDLLNFTRGLNGEARDALVAYGRAAGLTGDAQSVLTQLFQRGDAAARMAADGTDLASAEMAIAEENAEALNQELETLIENFLELTTGAKSTQQANDALSSAFNKAKKGADELRNSGRGLGDILSATDDDAISFRDSLFSLEQSAREAAVAILENGGSVEDAKKKYQDGRQAVIDIATSMGVPPKKAKAWADEMFGSSKAINADLQAIADQTDMVNKKDITIDVDADPKKYNDKTRQVGRSADGLDRRIIRPTMDSRTEPFNAKYRTSKSRIQELGRAKASPYLGLRDDVFYRDYKGSKSRLRELGNAKASPFLGLRDDVFYRDYRGTKDRLRELGSAKASPYLGTRGSAYQTVWSTLVWLKEIVSRNWDANSNIRVHTTYSETHQQAQRTPGHGAFSGYADGGYTGAGGKHDVAGLVHRGEYVIPKHMVNQSTGLPFADALGRLTRGHNTGIGYSNGGHVTQRDSVMPSTVTLSPMSIQQLAQAVQADLLVDGQRIAQSVSRVYTNSSRRGTN